MSQTSNWWRALVLSAVVLCIVFAASAGGQAGKNSTFATIDFQRVSNEYKAKVAAENDLQALNTKYMARLQRRNDMPFLTEADQTQLDTLYEGGQEQNKAKIADIEGKAKQANDEINVLRQKKETDLTDGDKKKIDDAAKQFQAAQDSYAKLKDTYNNELRQKSTEQTDKLMKEIRDAVRKVAEQKGIAIVFNGDVALYAGNDITQTVLDTLNKK